MKPRVLSRKSAEALLLPPRNFRLRSGQIGQLFYEFTRGSRAWDDHSMEGEALKMFDHDDLPNFLRQSERQSIFQDARGLVFPCARPLNSMAHLRPHQAVRIVLISSTT